MACKRNYKIVITTGVLILVFTISISLSIAQHKRQGRSSSLNRTESFVPVGGPKQLSSASNSSPSLPSEVVKPEVHTLDIVARYKHDPKAFTQGLLYGGNDTLYESTGLYYESSIRLVELQTGKVLRRIDFNGWVFGEGLTMAGGKLLHVVWKSNEGSMYDPATFNRIGTFRTPMTDGWGLTYDGANVIGSDGTSSLYFFDPVTFVETNRLSIVDDGRNITDINELEYINGEVWANIWMTDCIARISPTTGRVVGWIHVPNLKTDANVSDNPDNVLNGIAFDVQGDRIFVTGKRWPVLYEVRLRSLTKEEENSKYSLEAVRAMCFSQ